MTSMRSSESGSLSDSDSVRDILTQLERANVDLVVVDGGGNAILTTLGVKRSAFERNVQRLIRNGRSRS